MGDYNSHDNNPLSNLSAHICLRNDADSSKKSLKNVYKNPPKIL